MSRLHPGPECSRTWGCVRTWGVFGLGLREPGLGARTSGPRQDSGPEGWGPGEEGNEHLPGSFRGYGGHLPHLAGAARAVDEAGDAGAVDGLATRAQDADGGQALAAAPVAAGEDSPAPPRALGLAVQ